MRGYVYILKNKSLKKNYLKIGRTEREPEMRAKELGGTGVPDKYEVVYYEIFDNCYEAEKMIHKRLQKYRVNNRREFFGLPLQDAINAIHSAAIEELRQKNENQNRKIKKLENQINLKNGEEWWNNLSEEWKGFLLERIGLEGYDFYGNYSGLIPSQEELVQIINLSEMEGNELPFDLSPLKFLKKIRKIRYEMGGETPHKLFEIIDSFPLLEDFIFRWSNLSDISKLSSLKNLRYLNLDATPIDNFEIISKLSKLTNLSLEQTLIRKIESIDKLSKLEFLSLSYNEIKDFTPLLKLKGLKVLHFNCGGTDSIIPLIKHQSLEKISICDTEIGDSEDISNHEIEMFKKLNKGCQIITSWEDLWN